MYLAVPEQYFFAVTEALMDTPNGKTHSPENGSALSPRAKVLLVDDHPGKLLALASVFDGLGIELVMAHSGKEALRLLLVDEFAVILLDIMMPIMDGFETATLIHQRKKSQHTPIIFITAMDATEAHIARGYALGVVDYIFAPVAPDVLRAKVSVFIDLFTSKSKATQQANELFQVVEQRADHLESRLESLLNRLNVGVFRTTIDGNLITANPAYFKLYGMNPSVDPGTVNVRQFYLNADDQQAITDELRSTGRVFEHHVQHRRSDHTTIWVSISKTLVVDSTGRECIDGLVEDITARKKSEYLLITKAEELARSNTELEEFAFIASHDLQEPLRMVSSYSSLIAARYGPSLDDQGRTYLAQVEEGAKRMQSLIRDVLAYSQLGRECTASAVDCNDVMERVRFAFQALLAENDITLDQKNLPTVLGDRVLIGQIFHNLVGNAIKFRRTGVKPHIKITANRSGSFWEFSINDNWIGISADAHHRIFSVFQRLHSREEYNGTGIGLAICRRAVHRQGGDIRLVSKPNEGSTFIFTLPCLP